MSENENQNDGEGEGEDDDGQMHGDDNDNNDSNDESRGARVSSETVAHLDADDSDDADEKHEKHPDDPETQEMVAVAKAHKRQLQKMKDSQKEFFEFLKQNDPNLLQFGEELSSGDEGTGDEAEESEEEESEEEEEEETKPHETKQKRKGKAGSDEETSDAEDDDEEGSMEDDDELEGDVGEVSGEGRGSLLTLTKLKQWQAEAWTKRNLSNIRRVIFAFRSACDAGQDRGDKKSNSKKSKLRIADGTVFIASVRFCCGRLPAIFDSILEIDTDSQSGQPVLPSSSPKFKSSASVIKQYLSYLVGFVVNCQMSDPSMRCYILSHCERMAFYLSLFPTIAKKLIKAVLQYWAAPNVADSNKGQGASESVSLEPVRIHAFLVLRRLCLAAKVPYLELALKGLYLSFARFTKTVTSRNVRDVAVMRNCIVELCAIDSTVAYQHAFVYLRQLAIHLRNALTAKTKDAHQLVYNWQFVSSLEVWVSAAAAHASNPDLKLLAYPASQIILGTVRLIPTLRFSPLRLHLCRLATLLCSATGSYIPMAPVVLEMLASSQLTGTPPSSNLPKNATPPKFDFSTHLKVTKATLLTRSFQDDLVTEILYRLGEHFAAMAHWISFPELAVPALFALRKHAQSLGAVRHKRQIMALVEQIQAQVAFVESKRSRVTFGPSDQKACQAFLTDAPNEIAASPLVKYHTIQTETRKHVTWSRGDDEEDDDEEGGDEDSEDGDDKNKKYSYDDDDEGSQGPDDDQGSDEDDKKPQKNKKKGKNQKGKKASASKQKRNGDTDGPPLKQPKPSKFVNQLSASLAKQPADVVADFDLDGF
eukprot:c18831_g1_i3.p1 GENE.c18831_g1_i3~~c18831_g1_i3.p1  ORF type:complete len:952 (+),score=259.17 c18831_g1_i3:401-2857(+)